MMTRAICRRCGKPKNDLERWCSTLCRLMDQGKLKPDGTKSPESWDLVTKTTNPAPWWQR